MKATTAQDMRLVQFFWVANGLEIDGCMNMNKNSEDLADHCLENLRKLLKLIIIKTSSEYLNFEINQSFLKFLIQKFLHEPGSPTLTWVIIEAITSMFGISKAIHMLT